MKAEEKRSRAKERKRRKQTRNSLSFPFSLLAKEKLTCRSAELHSCNQLKNCSLSLSFAAPAHYLFLVFLSSALSLSFSLIQSKFQWSKKIFCCETWLETSCSRKLFLATIGKESRMDQFLPPPNL